MFATQWYSGIQTTQHQLSLTNGIVHRAPSNGAGVVILLPVQRRRLWSIVRGFTDDVIGTAAASCSRCGSWCTMGGLQQLPMVLIQGPAVWVLLLKVPASGTFARALFLQHRDEMPRA